jgi:MFS family permease
VPRATISIIIALLCNVIQHCEYALFGLSSAIIVKVFFPQGEILDRLIWFYTLLLVSVFFKPLGSYIFGRIGDIYGRSKTFKIGMFISGFSTLSIGLIPSFEQIGYLSLFMLIFCRISLIMTGNIDNVTIYITESISKNHKNFASGLIGLSVQTGILLASIAFYISDYYKTEYLWRMNFIISGLLGLLMLLLRKFIIESSEFEIYKNNNQILKQPLESIFTLIKKQRIVFSKAMIMHGSIGGIYNFYILFFTNYVFHIIKIDNNHQSDMAINIGIACCAILAPVAGLLADKFNSKKQILYFLVINLLIIIINIILINYNYYSFVLHIILLSIYPFFVIPIIIEIKEMFDVKVRMRLYGLSHTIGSTILSSSTPLICTILFKVTSIYFAPLLYLLFLNILLIIFTPKNV